MLKTRIIPTLLWKGPGLVKGVGFDSWRRIGTILPAVKVYNSRQVDELIIVDICATLENRIPDLEEISGFAKECFVPLTIGGGIKSVTDVRKLLAAGADKVCLNSSAYERPLIIKEIANCFGSQCIVVSIDVRKEGNNYFCYSHSGKVKTAYKVEDWCKTIEGNGAGELLVTSIENDGLMQGYDIKLLQKISSIVNIPVIASGGAGKMEDFYHAIAEGGASAVAAASIFHFTQHTPLEVKKYLKLKNIPVRTFQQSL